MKTYTTVCATRQGDTRGLGYLLGGLALVALSATINIKHTIAHSSDPLDMLLSGGLALAMTVGFVVLPVFAASALRNRHFGFVVAAWIGVLICGGISLTNIIGASMGQRLATSAEASDAARKREDARKIIVKNEADLVAIGIVRASAAVQADIDAKLTSRRDLDGCDAKWLPSSGARAVCIEVQRLRAEKAKSDRVADLTGEISGARATINGTAASATIGNGDTAAIIAAARRFGWEFDVEAVDLVKSIGLALGVELFASLLFLAWERSREGYHPTEEGRLGSAHFGLSIPVPTVGTEAIARTQAIAPRVPAIECREMLVRSSLGHFGSQANVPACPAQDAAADDAVLAVLRARGGTVLASQRVMAELFGMSRSSVNRVLHELAASGRVKLVTTAKGTAVTLISPSKIAA